MKEWILSHLDLTVREEGSAASQLATNAYHLAILVDDGELDQMTMKKTLAEAVVPWRHKIESM